MRARICWLIVLGTLLGGCGAMLESSSVSRRFSSVFGCPAAKVTRSAGGYRVEGCGMVAHFACFDPHPHHHTVDDVRPGKGRVAVALVGSLVAASLHADRCLLEHSERSVALVSASPLVPTPVHSKAGRLPLVRMRTLLAGGHLAALGKPTQHTAHALLTVHSLRRLAAAPCRAELFSDGVGVPVEEVQRVDDFEVRLLVRSESLRDLDRTARFAGSVCGFEFVLDDRGREALGHFEARFRELGARAATSAEALATP